MSILWSLLLVFEIALEWKEEYPGSVKACDSQLGRNRVQDRGIPSSVGQFGLINMHGIESLRVYFFLGEVNQYSYFYYGI